MSLYIKHAHFRSGPIVMEHIIIRHLFIAWQCLALGHRHVLFNNAGILQCLPFITLKVENRVQKPLALKHELCRPMTVKREMSIWIGEKDFAGCPSNATVFSFPTFAPPWVLFLRRCWGLTGWPPVGEGLFYCWRRRVKVAEQIKPSAAGRLTQGPGWEPAPPGSHEKSWGKSKAYVCEESKLIFRTPLTNAGISKVHHSCDVINDGQSNDWQ